MSTFFGSVAVCFILIFLAMVHGATVVPFTACSNCQINAIYYCPPPVVFILTSDNSLWRSTDEGLSWNKTLSNIVEIDQHTADSATIIATDTNHMIHVTKDSGLTFGQYNLPQLGQTGSLVLHPLLIGALIYTCGRCTPQYSLDEGETWQSLRVTVYEVAWSRDSTTTSTIFVQAFDNTFKFTSDYGYTFTQLLAPVFGFILTDAYMWVGVVVNSVDVTLYVSSSVADSTHTDKRSYIECEFPFGEDLPEQGYTILSDGVGTDFIGVSLAQNWGSIFNTENLGSSWVLSLNHAAQQLGTYDFDNVGAIPGVYISNGVSNYQQPNADPSKLSYITFDNGGNWRQLTAPSVDWQGHPISCMGCSLQLHGLTSYYYGWEPPFYSSSNAVGLILAVGNVGTNLTHDTNTYFSRDAGLSWLQIAPIRTIYEFGDHGGILVWAPYGEQTNRVWYSFDEANSSIPVNFTTYPGIFVYNIITEFSGTGRTFILYGNLQGEGYIFGLDFSDVQPRLCTDNDYELWSPSDGESGPLNCELGQTTVYSRRKRFASCYNNRTTEHVVGVTPCPCTYEDYECDFGFVQSPRDATDAFTCTPTGNTRTNIPPPNWQASCGQGETFNVITGYKTVAQTHCLGGLDLSPKVLTCPTRTPDSKSNSGVVIAIVVVVLVVVAAIVGFAFLVKRKPTIIGNITGLFRRRESYSRVNVHDDEEEDNTP